MVESSNRQLVTPTSQTNLKQKTKHRSPFDFISSFSSKSLNSSLSNNYFKKDSSVLGGAVGSFSDIFSDFSSISKD
jgi:hypothetical protein